MNAHTKMSLDLLGLYALFGLFALFALPTGKRDK